MAKKKKKKKDSTSLLFAMKAIAKKKGNAKQYRHFDKKIKAKGL